MVPDPLEPLVPFAGAAAAPADHAGTRPASTPYNPEARLILKPISIPSRCMLVRFDLGDNRLPRRGACFFRGWGDPSLREGESTFVSSTLRG